MSFDGMYRTLKRAWYGEEDDDIDPNDVNLDEFAEDNTDVDDDDVSQVVDDMEDDVPKEHNEQLATENSYFGKKLGTFEYWYFIPRHPAFRVRGEKYKSDKVKVSSGAHKFDCVGCDLYGFKSVKPLSGIASNFQDIDMPNLHQTMKATRFKFIVHFLIPGSPNLGATFYFVAKEGVLENDSKFAKLFQKFVSKTLPDDDGVQSEEAADAYRTSTFKVIPRFVNGASMARRVAGERPAIICKKIPSKFYVGDDYCEVDLDISNSRIAKTIFKLVKNQLKGLVLDLAFLIEGSTEAELPEEILGGLRIKNPSLDKIAEYEAAPEAN